MKKFTRNLGAILAISAAAVIVAGCSSSTSSTKSGSATGSGVDGAPSQTQKVGTTSKTGVISKITDKYFIQETGKQPAQIDTYSLDLSKYVGQTVTVSGEYSGDTLFVTKVE